VNERSIADGVFTSLKGFAQASDPRTEARCLSVSFVIVTHGLRPRVQQGGSGFSKRGCALDRRARHTHRAGTAGAQRSF
jgi:hypothetical protein